MKFTKKKKMLCLCMVAVMLASLAAGTPEVFAKNQASADWMAGVDGETKLSAISIPGTHDTCTQYVSMGYIFQCQDTDVKTQLKNGYRYLDMRLVIGEKDEKAALVMKHNFASCRTGKTPFSSKLYFDDVVDDTVAFLKKHPSETVIMCMKAENGDDAIKDVQKLLYEKIDREKEMWYTENEIPALDDVRGKIVLATRFEDALGVGDSRRGLNFAWVDQGDRTVVDVPYVLSMINADEKLWVQDRFNYNADDKIDAIVDDLENCQAADDTFSLNFTSTSGSGKVGHPKKYATAINRYLMDYDWQSQTCYGIVIVDFATENLAKCIYGTNDLKY